MNPDTPTIELYEPQFQVPVESEYHRDIVFLKHIDGTDIYVATAGPSAFYPHNSTDPRLFVTMTKAWMQTNERLQYKDGNGFFVTWLDGIPTFKDAKPACSNRFTTEAAFNFMKAYAESLLNLAS